jgi:hypothetical protein
VNRRFWVRQTAICAGERIPESAGVRAKTQNEQKGTLMHIASGLTFVRRDPAQSDVASGHRSRRAWFRRSEQAAGNRYKLGKILPGAIFLAALAALGAMFPILF